MDEKLIELGNKILNQLKWECDINTTDKSIGYVEGLANKNEPFK